MEAGGIGLPSEFLREGPSTGLLLIGGDAGAEDRTWLGLRDEREEKGKRELELAGEGDGGCSSSGVEGVELRTGDGERRPGNAERKLFEGRLVG